jgi:ribonucleoside-diphosphate reductase beta chain
MLSTLNLTAASDKLFFGQSGHGIARYDIPRYPIFKKMNDKMRSLYWNFEEIDMAQEKSAFNKMTDAEKWVFTENLKRQILLDSIQGRAPALVFLPHCTDSSLENCLTTWQFFESLHSES